MLHATIDGTDLNKANDLIDEMAPIFAQAVDIHTHTRWLGPKSLPFFEMDEKYHISNPKSFAVTKADILSFCGNHAQVATVLASVQHYNNAVDGETGLRVMDLLCKTWDLAKKLNYEHLVIDNLKHNKETGGGCYPGISARLIQPYTNFITVIMRRRKNEELGIQERRIPSLAEKEQAQMAQAIEASLVSHDTSSRESELSDLERAMIASLAVSTPSPRPAVDTDLERALAASLLEANEKNAEEEDAELQMALAMSGGLEFMGRSTTSSTSTTPAYDEEEALRRAMEESRRMAESNQNDDPTPASKVKVFKGLMI